MFYWKIFIGKKHKCTVQNKKFEERKKIIEYFTHNDIKTLTRLYFFLSTDKKHVHVFLTYFSAWLRISSNRCRFLRPSSTIVLLKKEKQKCNSPMIIVGSNIKKINKLFWVIVYFRSFVWKNNGMPSIVVCMQEES